MANERYPAVLIRLKPHVKAALQAEADAQMRSLTNLATKILTDHGEQSAKLSKPLPNGADHKAPKARVPA